MTTRCPNKKVWSQLLALLLSCGITTTALSAEITEAVINKDQTTVDTTPSTKPSSTDSTDPLADSNTEDEENVLSSRLDPKHQQYMRGQLAYWFEMYETAFKLWMPLAEEGEPKSQTNIGWLYHQGLSVEKDLEQAEVNSKTQFV